jgi:hypothetical protein
MKLVRLALREPKDGALVLCVQFDRSHSIAHSGVVVVNISITLITECSEC